MYRLISKATCIALAIVLSPTVIPNAARGQSIIPRLVRFSGVAMDANGHVPAGEVALTFTLYEEQQGGAPLWSETQAVQPDSQGHYSVLLGSTQSNGLPQELFTGNKARWVGVQPNLVGTAEQPRVLLVGVPYAMKASDAETLGGLPASSYVTTEALMTALPQSVTPRPAAPSGAAFTAHPEAVAAPAAGSGETNYVPLWTSNQNQGDSVLYQSGTGSSAKIGIGTTAPAATLDIHGGVTVRGDLILPPAGLANATTGTASEPLDFKASSFNSSTNLAVTQDFRWEAEPQVNDSQAPAGSLNLLFGANGATPSETGLFILENGVINFAPGQTFPSVTGNENVSGILTASQLSSTAPAGTPPLTVSSSTQVPNLNASLLGGLGAGAFAQLAAANTFSASQTINGNVTSTGTMSAANMAAANSTVSSALSANTLAMPPTAGLNTGVLFIGGVPFLHTAGGTSNTYIGSAAGNINTTGTFNSVYGNQALDHDTMGFQNTAMGFAAGNGTTTGSNGTMIGVGTEGNNPTGSNNTALGAQAGNADTSGSNNTFLGANSNPAAGNLTNATAVGYGASVGQSNALVLGGTGSNAVHVGIGTATPGEPLSVQADDSTVTPSQLMIQGATTPSKQLIIGYSAHANQPDAGYGSIQALQQNLGYTPLSLNPLGGGVVIGGSTIASLTLTLGQGQGSAIGDGWATYSSRRWKTNIQTLPDALRKVQRLRGVSYDLKANGKHEIGVIAEEVGAVVPEVVTWEKNGKDAQSVDYTRLTALLIEAVKQQQQEARAKDARIARLTTEVNRLRKLGAQVAALQVRLNRMERRPAAAAPVYASLQRSARRAD